MAIRCSQHSRSIRARIYVLLFIVVSFLSVGLLQADQNKSHEQHAALAVLQNRALASACHNEYAEYCRSDSDTPACRMRLVDTLALSVSNQQSMLGTCCTAKLHELGYVKDKFKVDNFSGVEFSSGAELHYDHFCETATLISDNSAHYKAMEVQAGPMVFSGLGNLKLARLRGRQDIHNLQLGDEQPLTQFFDSGVPKLVRLHGVSRQHGIRFQPMDQSDAPADVHWSSVPIDLLYQLALGSGHWNSKTATALHSNGRVAKGNIAEPVVINGLPMAAGVTELNENGQVMTGKLSMPHLHNGLLLGPGTIEFDQNGNLTKAILAAGVKLNGLELDTPSKISMSPDGTYKSIILGYTELDSNPHKPVKLGPFVLQAGLLIRLYENYQVQSIRTNEHSWYQGRAYPKQTELKFSENGDVAWDSFHDELLVRAKQNPGSDFGVPEILPTAEVRGGRLLPKGTLIYSVGRVGAQRIAVPNAFYFNGYKIAAGEFLVDENLKIREAKLERRVEYYGAELKAYPHTVTFSETGAITGASLYADSFINGIQYSKDSSVSFSPNGKVLSGWLASVTSIDGRHYKANSVLNLDNDGAVKKGVLAEDWRIGKVLIPAESAIAYKSGKKIEVSSKNTINIDGIEYSGNSVVLRQDGSIDQGKLFSDTEIQGEFYEADTKLIFRADGNIAYHFPPSELDKLRAVSGPTLMAGPGKPAAAMPALSPQACQLFVERSKQRRGYWLTGGVGFSAGMSGSNPFQNCIDSVIYSSDNE